MLIVLRAGDAVPQVAAKRGEFFRWIREGVGDAWSGAWGEIDLRDENAPLPDAHSASGFIITGSASSVTERARWMLRAQTWLRDATLADAPIFGICFGHQMLAEALGGRVIKNPHGREIGTITVNVAASAMGDAIFGVAPKEILANATHVDAVAELPAGATLLASTSLDPNAAFRIRRAWGVQFHPEIDADLMRGYLTARKEIIIEERLPHAQMFDAVRDAPDAMGLMRSFVRAI